MLKRIPAGGTPASLGGQVDEQLDRLANLDAADGRNHLGVKLEVDLFQRTRVQNKIRARNQMGGQSTCCNNTRFQAGEVLYNPKDATKDAPCRCASQ